MAVAMGHRTRRLTILVVAFLITAIAGVLLTAAAAQAEECKTKWGVTVCGEVYNNTSSTMRTASLTDKGKSQCGAVRNSKGAVLDRKWKCNIRNVGPGNFGSLRDTDAITFDRSFQVNEHEFKAGEWVKVKGVVCKNFKQRITIGWMKTATLWDTQPRCYGFV